MKEFLASFKSSLPAWSVPLCGLTGAALFLAGTVCFVAYNWAALGTLYKFALPLLGLLVCAWGAYIKGLQSGTGKAFSFACGLFIGLFWVVYGQVYQSGAFVYEFCLAWALSLLPLALLAGNRWLWLLWAAVSNLYIISYYWVPMADASDGGRFFWCMFALNILCFAASEWTARRRGKGGWFSLFFLAAALWACLLHGIGLWNGAFWTAVCLILLLGVYAWRFKRGATQLAFCALALDILFAERIISTLRYGGDIVTVLAVLAVFVLSAGGVYVLSRQGGENE